MAKRELNEKQKIVLEVLFGEAEGDLKKAMDLAGYSKGYSAKAFRENMVEEITEATKKFISSDAVAKAAFTMRNAMEVKDAKDLLGEKERIAVARDILGRAGISETNKIEIETSSPLFILPAKEDAPN